MASRIEAGVNNSGGTSVVIRPVTHEEQKRLDDMMAGEDVEASPGRRLFRKTADVEKNPVYERIEIEGEVMFARAFDYPAYLQFNMLSGRNKAGEIDPKLTYEEVARANVVALIHCGIVKSPADPSPVFTKEEINDAIDSTEPVHHDRLAMLSGMVIMRNSHLFEKARKVIQEQERLMSEGKKKDGAEASTTPPRPSLLTGSKATESTEPPSTSLIDSMASTESTDTPPATLSS